MTSLTVLQLLGCASVIPMLAFAYVNGNSIKKVVINLFQKKQK